MCIGMYIFCLKKPHKQKGKETKQETEKPKKPKKKRRKEISLLWTVSVENLTGYDDIVCEFALSSFNLRDQAVNFAWLCMWI